MSDIGAIATAAASLFGLAALGVKKVFLTPNEVRAKDRLAAEKAFDDARVQALKEADERDKEDAASIL